MMKIVVLKQRKDSNYISKFIFNSKEFLLNLNDFNYLNTKKRRIQCMLLKTNNSILNLNF